MLLPRLVHVSDIRYYYFGYCIYLFLGNTYIKIYIHLRSELQIFTFYTDIHKTIKD